MKKISKFAVFMTVVMFAPFLSQILPANAATLYAPSLTAPASDQVLTNFPRNATFNWSAVTGATRYELEIACDVCVSKTNKWANAKSYSVTGTSYTTKVPGADNQFRWRVRGYNGSTAGNWSVYRYFRYNTKPGSSNPVTTAPVITAPTANQVFTNPNTSISVNWNKVSGATGYQFELYEFIGSDKIWGAEVTANSYSINIHDIYQEVFDSSIMGHFYFVLRVRAIYSGSQYGSWSDYCYFSVSASSHSGKPDMISPANNQVFYTNNIALDWTDVGNIMSYWYSVEKYLDYNGTWSTETIGGSSQESVATLTLNSTSYGKYRVRVQPLFALNEHGDWSDYRYFEYRENGSNTLTAPVIIVPTAGQDVNSNTMTASWYAVSGAVSYEINTNYESYGNWYEEGTYTGITALSKTIGPLAVNEYRMKIRAKFSNGSYTNWSDWRYFDMTNGSNSSVGMPTLSAPADEAHVTSNYVYLDWSTVTDATSYEYQVTRYIDGWDWADVTSGTVTASEKTVTLTSGLYGQYSFRVRAVKNGSYGNWTGYNHFYYDNGSSNYTKPVVQTPSQNSTVENSTRQVSLSWSGVSDAYEYQVQIGPDGSSASYYTTANTTYTYTAPTDNIWYKVYVRAHLSGGSYTNWSDERMFYYHYTGSTGSDYTAPIITSPSAGQTVYSNLVYSIWNPVSTAISYEVNVNYKTGNSWMEEGTYTVTSADKTLYLNYTNDYRMRVRAKFTDSTYTSWSGWREFKVQL
jgi:hypothetical protein